MRIIYKNADVYRTDCKKIERCDVAVSHGKVVAVEKNIQCSVEDQVYDLSGLTLLPGLVDVHVHLREPGFSKKETIATGTMAAAHGGFTTVCSMPNLKPAPDDDENLRIQEDLIAQQAVVNVLPLGCITKGQLGKGELVDFDRLKDRVFGFSDDGRGVQSDELMEEAMRRCKAAGKPIVAHCEVDSLINGGYIHDGEYARLNGHKGICSESEWLQVKRDIEKVEKTGCQYHVCHVSTRESVELIRQAKKKGLPVSGETAPHYLLLTDLELEEDGRFKMNPPIRSKDDQLALVRGILDGTIECISTDHAPHTEHEKSKGLHYSMMGIVGLETSFPLMYRYFVVNGRMSLEHLMSLMADNPRRLFGLSGGTAIGDVADFSIWDLNARYEVDPSTFLSMGKATPFTGWTVQGKSIMTIVKGQVVYKDKDYVQR